MRRVHVDPFARDAGRLGDRLEGLLHEGIGQMQVVDAVDERLVRAVRHRHAVDVERIEHPVGDAVGEVAHERYAERRGGVYPGETSLELRENRSRPEGERQRYRLFHHQWPFINVAVQSALFYTIPRLPSNTRPSPRDRPPAPPSAMSCARRFFGEQPPTPLPTTNQLPYQPPTTHQPTPHQLPTTIYQLPTITSPFFQIT